MTKTVGIGIQSFDKVITGNYFYIDKTDFIKEWWESGDDVTLITRPRRFGKTLNMSMLEQFFSVDIYSSNGLVYFERTFANVPLFLAVSKSRSRSGRRTYFTV